MGDNSVVRVKTLLGKLHSVANSKDRGSQISQEGELLLNRSIQQLEEIFEKLPKLLEWRSFYNNDLNLLVQAPQEVRGGASRRFGSARTKQIVYLMICALVPTQIIWP